MHKSKKEKIPLFFSAALFLLSGSVALGQSHYLWGILNIIAGLANITALRYVRIYPEFAGLFINIFNALLAYLTALFSFIAGTKYLHFAWILAGSLYLLVSLIFLKKAQKKYLK